MNTNVVELSAGVDGFPRERQQAIALHQATNLTYTAVAAKIGVPKNIVCRWLRSEGISPRHRRGHPGGQDRERISSDHDDIANLRRDLTVLIGQMGRLEGRIQALLGSKHRSAA
jgi:hypothetical protein